MNESPKPPVAHKVLVTGGAGYIGSTICSALEDSGHSPVVLDSLINGREAFARAHPLYKGDIADPGVISQIFEDHPDIEFTIHCAALAVVPDSVGRPYEYYRNNVTGSAELFRMLAGARMPERRLQFVRRPLRQRAGLHGYGRLPHPPAESIRQKQADDRDDARGYGRELRP